jgi:hypothetical protein
MVVKKIDNNISSMEKKTTQKTASNESSKNRQPTVVVDKLLRRWKTPNILEVIRGHHEFTKLLITSSIIFLKYRFINKKMVITAISQVSEVSKFVR